MVSQNQEIKLDVSSGETDRNVHQIHLPINLKFRNLSVKANDKLILENVFGEFLPGEIVAIMGSSGKFC